MIMFEKGILFRGRESKRREEKNKRITKNIHKMDSIFSSYEKFYFETNFLLHKGRQGGNEKKMTHEYINIYI